MQKKIHANKFDRVKKQPVDFQIHPTHHVIFSIADWMSRNHFGISPSIQFLSHWWSFLNTKESCCKGPCSLIIANSAIIAYKTPGIIHPRCNHRRDKSSQLRHNPRMYWVCIIQCLTKLGPFCLFSVSLLFCWLMTIRRYELIKSNKYDIKKEVGK